MKSNISKQFAAKAKRGLRFADGLVQDRMVEGTPSNTPWAPNADQSAMLASYNARLAPANQPAAASGGLTQGEQSSLAIQSDMNNLGTVNPTPGLGQGAQHNFFNKSMSDLQGGNQPYMPGSANDPHASASIGPKGPTRLPQAAPARTPLRQWQEPAFADGVVPETADQLMARMTAKYGAPSAGTKSPEPAPAPAPQPVQQAPQPKPQSGGLFGQAMRGLRSANDQLRQVANYKDGMVHEGPGIVHGPGGPKEDKVDAKLSNGEAVLPAATVAALGGADQVADLIERTNGKAPTMGLRGGQEVHAANGWTMGADGVMREAGTAATPAAQQATNVVKAIEPVVPPTANTPAVSTGQVYDQPMKDVGGSSIADQKTARASGDPRTAQGARTAGGVSPEAAAYTRSQEAAAQAAAKKPTLAANAVGSAKSVAGSVMRGAAKIAAPLAAIDGVMGVAGGLTAQGNRTYDDINERGGFAASTLKDGLPMLSAVGQKIGDDAGRVYQAATGGRNAHTGEQESVWNALTTKDGGPSAVDYYNQNSTPTTPVAPAAQPAKALSADDQEAMRDAAMASTLGAPGRPMDDKSMAYLRSQGVDTGLRRAARDDVNTINGNGPEKVQGGAVNIINTKNGPVYAGRDGKGQLVVTSGLDRSDADQAAATKSGQEQAAAIAAKDKVDLRAMQRERLTRDTGADITDPRVVQAGLRGLSQMDRGDAGATAAANHKDEIGLRTQQLGLIQRSQDIGDQHFQQELAARTAAAQALAREKGVKDLDTLIEGQGVDDPKEFRDFMRNNFFGRKHLIGGKEVDVPGMEDMSSDQMRALMPTALMQHRFNKEFNAASSTGTSKNAAKKLRERATNYSDVEKNAFGIPSFGTADNKNKLTLAELINSKLPDGLRQVNPMMLEEYDPATGGVIRKARKGLLAGQPDQSIDRAAYINSLK